MLCDALPQVVLGDDVDGKLVFLQLDVGVVVDGFEQSPFDFGTGVVLVVKDAEFGVAAFAVQVETVAGPAFVEIDPILHQFADAVGGFADGHFHHLAVADAVAGNQRVLNVFVKAVAVVHDGGYSALGISGRALGSFAFAKDAYFAVRGYFQCIAQPRNPRPNDQEIDFVSHGVCDYSAGSLYVFNHGRQVEGRNDHGHNRENQ